MWTVFVQRVLTARLEANSHILPKSEAHSKPNMNFKCNSKLKYVRYGSNAHCATTINSFHCAHHCCYSYALSLWPLNMSTSLRSITTQTRKKGAEAMMKMWQLTWQTEPPKRKPIDDRVSSDGLQHCNIIRAIYFVASTNNFPCIFFTFSVCLFLLRRMKLQFNGRSNVVLLLLPYALSVCKL